MAECNKPEGDAILVSAEGFAEHRAHNADFALPAEPRPHTAGAIENDDGRCLGGRGLLVRGLRQTHTNEEGGHEQTHKLRTALPSHSVRSRQAAARPYTPDRK